MLRQLRKFAWLIVASAIALSFTIGAVLAHEGRPIGDYRLIVGWQEEPAYEGVQNAVSVRVNKIVEGSMEDETAGVEKAEEGDHGSPGHHGEDPESTPATSQDEQEAGEGEDHHGTEDEDRDVTEDGDGQGGSGHHGADDADGQEGHGDPGSSDGDSTAMTGMAHGEGGHHDGTIETGRDISVALQVTGDLVSGANVQIIPEGFEFAPENVNGTHVDGEGHAHIYVDGVKISRVYTPWYYLADLTPGEHEIRATLNANSHEEYSVGGEKVEAVTQFSFQEPHGHPHAPNTLEAANSIEVSISLEPDPLGGANVLVATEGFTFAPENAGDRHITGAGHGQVSVNGVETGRLYGEAMQLGNLAEGKNKVRVTLNTNDFSDYTWNGNPVEATASINIEAGMGGAGYGDPPTALGKPGDKPDEYVNINDESNHHGEPGEGNGMVEKETSWSLAPLLASKPLASIAGQDEGQAVSVEGLEGILKVEVIHAASGASRTMELEAVWGDPGHYVAALIPTASGVYEFRVFGTIEGTTIDETFVSQGAGGNFDDIQSSAELQFPEQLPEMREVVGAVQGARDIAQQAQDTALANQDARGNALAVIALIVGIAGAVLGAGGVFLAMRGRESG